MSNKVDIIYDAWKPEYIPFASCQINKIISLFKKQEFYEYRVIICSSLESSLFKYIDRSFKNSYDETNSDGYVSSGKVFFYPVAAEDTRKDHRKLFKRISDGGIVVEIKEDQYICHEKLVEKINTYVKPVSFRVFEVSSKKNQLLQTDKYQRVIYGKIDDEESNIIDKIMCDDLCVIEFGSSSKFTGKCSFLDNKHFDQESKDLLPEGVLRGL